MNCNASYISRLESSSIKAFLIFLIVLGHNMVFTYSLEKYHIMEYLYNFHIQAFFLLPFLYGSNKLTKKKLSNYFMRLYWPYIILTFISYILYYICFTKGKPEIIGVIQMLITGDVQLIKHYCGVQIYWFLPAMFSLSYIKDIYYYSNRYVKYTLLITSGISLLLSILASDYGHFYNIYNKINSVVPLGTFKAIAYLAYGVLLRRLVEWDYSKQYINAYTLFPIFLILSIIFFYNKLDLNNTAIFITLRIIFPVIFILLLLSIRKVLASYLYLQKIGRHTLSIYIFHPYIGYIIYFIALRFHQINLLAGIVSQALIFFGATAISAIFDKTLIKKIVFPRNFEELQSVFIRK